MVGVVGSWLCCLLARLGSSDVAACVSASKEGVGRLRKPTDTPAGKGFCRLCFYDNGGVLVSELMSAEVVCP